MGGCSVPLLVVCVKNCLFFCFLGHIMYLYVCIGDVTCEPEHSPTPTPHTPTIYAPTIDDCLYYHIFMQITLNQWFVIIPIDIFVP